MHTNPPICCSCFCNEQLNKNVKCGKEYFTLNVSNIVLVIFKSFITFCWEKKRIKKNRNILVKEKSQLDYFPKSFSPSVGVCVVGSVSQCECVCGWWVVYISVSVSVCVCWVVFERERVGERVTVCMCVCVCVL